MPPDLLRLLCKAQASSRSCLLYAIQVSCLGGVATVLLVNPSPDLLFVDVVQQVVQHSLRLAMPRHGVQQGARSVTLAERKHVSVVTSAGKDFGRKLFWCQGLDPHWDSLGRFLVAAPA